MISPFLCVFIYIHAENSNRFHGSYENLWKSRLSRGMPRYASSPEYFLFGENYSIRQEEKQERGDIETISWKYRFIIRLNNRYTAGGKIVLKFNILIIFNDIWQSKNAKNVVHSRRGGNLPPATYRIQPVGLNGATLYTEQCSGVDPTPSSPGEGLAPW